MTDGQWFALLWGPFAVTMGTIFVVKRERISQLARRQRQQRGQEVTEHTQSPTLMAIGGAVFIVAGIVVFIMAITGGLR